MNNINNPWDILRLASLKHLDERLDVLRMQISFGKRQPYHGWAAIDENSLSDFEDAIKSFQDSVLKHDYYQQLISKLLSSYNKFVDMGEPLEGHYNESGWCEEAKGLIIRYLARVVKYTLFEGPENCAYNMAKIVHQVPRGRNNLLFKIGDSLGDRDTICKFKVDQCYKCKIIPCEGRYIDGLCGYPEPALGSSIYKPVYKKRISSAVPSPLVSQQVINNYYTNFISQNNYSLIQQNLLHTDVFQIEETEREKTLNNMSRRQRESLNNSIKKMQKDGFCTSEGCFNDDALIKALEDYGDRAKRRGQSVLGLLKGLFADAIRKDAELGSSWVEVSALLNYSGIGSKYNEAKKYKESLNEQENGVFRCLMEIVQGVFPKYDG